MLLSPQQKPFRGTQLNRDHPLARSLVGCWLMNEGEGDEIANLGRYSNKGILTNNAAWADTEKGIGTEYPTDTGTDRMSIGILGATNPLGGVPTSQITLVARVYMTTPATHNNDVPRIFDKSNAGGGGAGWAVWYNSITNNFEGKIDNNENSLISTTTTYTTAGWYDVGVTFKAGNTNIYINGVHETFHSNHYTFSSVETPAAIGNWNHTTDRQWNGYILFVYVYSRIISNFEMAWLYREPYAMFQPEMSSAILYFDLVPSVDYGKTLMTMLI